MKRAAAIEAGIVKPDTPLVLWNNAQPRAAIVLRASDRSCTLFWGWACARIPLQNAAGNPAYSVGDSDLPTIKPNASRPTTTTSSPESAKPDFNRALYVTPSITTFPDGNIGVIARPRSPVVGCSSFIPVYPL